MSHAVTRHDGDQLKESAVAAKEAVTDLAMEAGRYANQRMSDAKQSAGVIVDTVKSKAGDYHDTFIGFVRQNPYKSLALAAGIGLAAGYMMRRR